MRALVVITATSAIAGVLLYLVTMQEVEARRFGSYNGTYHVSTEPRMDHYYQAEFGTGAYVSCAGAACSLVSFMISIPTLVLSIIDRRRARKAKKREKDHRSNSSSTERLSSSPGNTMNTSISPPIRRPTPIKVDVSADSDQVSDSHRFLFAAAPKLPIKQATLTPSDSGAFSAYSSVQPSPNSATASTLKLYSLTSV